MSIERNFCGRCAAAVKRASPVFVGELQELSGRYSDNKQRFDPSLTAGCVRCRHGGIQVLVCRPFSVRLRPFPTTFWLTCPYLERRAGMIESQGGVRELEEYMTSRKMLHEWRKYNFQHQTVRLGLMGRNFCWYMCKYQANIFRTVMRSGIGGMKLGENITVKCLHLQTAAYIGLGRHPASEWLKSKGLFGDCLHEKTSPVHSLRRPEY